MKMFEIPGNTEVESQIPPKLNIKTFILKNIIKKVVLSSFLHIIRIVITAFLAALILKHLIN